LAGCNKPASGPAPQQTQPAASNQQPQAPPTINGVTPPRALKRVHAEFPQQLWDKPGTVTVAVLIKTDGTVGEAKIVNSPHQELNQLALNAVKQWQFDPARKDGKPIPLTVTVNVQFAPPPQAGAAPAKQK
jgi:protein TonB